MKIFKASATKWFLSICFLFVLLLYAFFANEARKEIYYLCGNFSLGDTFDNVVRQLNTSTFSTSTISRQEDETKVIHTSALLLNLKACTVSFNVDDEVIMANYE